MATAVEVMAKVATAAMVVEMAVEMAAVVTEEAKVAEVREAG